MHSKQCLVCEDLTYNSIKGRFICSHHRPKYMASRYSGKCRFCGGQFKPGDKMVVVKSGHKGKWWLFHADGQCVGDEVRTCP